VRVTKCFVASCEAENELRCRLEEVITAMKTVKVKVPDWYPGYAVVPYYAPFYYPWYGYYVWTY